jgi:hypothetical protein
MPIKLPFGWWLCKDTTKPIDYPPRCREMLVNYRLEVVDLDEKLLARRKLRSIEGR